MQETFINIKSLDMDARGVGHLENDDGSQGKVIFVEGALPGERVSFETLRKKKNWESGRMVTLQKASSMRVEPKCPHFAQCGGCSMQHLEPSAQVAMKQRVLEDNLWHIGKTRAEHIMRPMYGPTWGYRYRARLSVRHVPKKGGILVGFHERHSSYVAQMTSCEIVPPHLSKMLVPLRELIGALSIYDQVPQIEVAVGEENTVLVLRIMAPLSPADEKLLKAFADQWNIQWWLQSKGPETAHPYYPLGKELYYTLPEFGIRMPFKPTDFTQVNHQINRLLVHKALGLLAVEKTRPRGRPVLRPRQLHAAAGHPGARSRGHRGQHRADHARARECARQRPGRQDQLLDPQPVRSDQGRPGRAGQVRPHAGRPAARRRHGPGHGPGRAAPDASGDDAEAYRVRVLQPIDPGARRRHPDAGRRLQAEQGGSGEHVPAYLARGVDCGVRFARGLRAAGVRGSGAAAGSLNQRLAVTPASAAINSSASTGFTK
jgi:hypothetical protein